MKEVAEDPKSYLATAAAMLSAEGLMDAARVLRVATPIIQETGYDNWNGGTRIWSVTLQVDPTEYAALGSKRELLEEQIASRLKPVIEQFSTDWFGVTIAPKVLPSPEWRHTGGDLSREVRQNIIDGLKLDKVPWSGKLGEVEFLERLYDLQAIPSNDPRFKDAAGDIWQHRINNPEDWDDDWVFGDRRFNLLQGPTDGFLRFLCEIVHPVVRPDRNAALKLVQEFNDQLRLEGWQLI